MRRLYLTSPVDRHNLGDWPTLGERLARAVAGAVGDDAEITVGEAPVFGDGTDVAETLLALEDEHLAPRAIRIDLWCSIAHYGVIAIALGERIQRKERRGVARKVDKALGGKALLFEQEGPFDVEDGRVYGYALDPADAADRLTIARFLDPFDPPLYVAERWLLQAADERLDPAFDVWKPADAPVVRFLVDGREAEERLWQASVDGHGLLACYNDDPAIGEMVHRFERRDDLRIFMIEKPTAAMRVTVGRGAPGEKLVVWYNSPIPGEEEEAIRFVI